MAFYRNRANSRTGVSLKSEPVKGYCSLGELRTSDRSLTFSFIAERDGVTDSKTCPKTNRTDIREHILTSN